jgi:DNA-binding NarL/FixJ family response regulator
MTPVTQASATTADRLARLFIVDDNPFVLQGFRLLFGLESDFSICGEAEGVSGTMARIARLRPDVVVVDISLADGNGLSLIRKLRETGQAVRIVVFSMHNEAACIEKAFAAGADAYVPKDQGAGQVVDVIRNFLSRE